jgi:hypothetical protein
MSGYYNKTQKEANQGVMKYDTIRVDGYCKMAKER